MIAWHNFPSFTMDRPELLLFLARTMLCDAGRAVVTKDGTVVAAGILGIAIVVGNLLAHLTRNVFKRDAGGNPFGVVAGGPHEITTTTPSSFCVGRT